MGGKVMDVKGIKKAVGIISTIEAIDKRLAKMEEQARRIVNEDVKCSLSLNVHNSQLSPIDQSVWGGIIEDDIDSLQSFVEPHIMLQIFNIIKTDLVIRRETLLLELKINDIDVDEYTKPTIGS
jgi:hypothetical protein